MMDAMTPERTCGSRVFGPTADDEQIAAACREALDIPVPVRWNWAAPSWQLTAGNLLGLIVGVEGIP